MRLVSIYSNAHIYLGLKLSYLFENVDNSEISTRYNDQTERAKVLRGLEHSLHERINSVFQLAKMAEGE